MSDHDPTDPICPANEVPGSGCLCLWLSAARADERARIEALLTLQESERIGDLLRPYEQEVRERIAVMLEDRQGMPNAAWYVRRYGSGDEGR